MKKLFSFLTVLLFMLTFTHGYAQGPQPQNDFAKKERRIFLWDVTISMVGATQNAQYPKGTKRSKPSFDYTKSNFPNYNKEKDIFDSTRETLLKLIDDIKTESTEIIVIPFRNDIVCSFEALATAEGKAKLRKDIMDWDDLKEGGTYTGTCLRKTIDKYFSEDRKNQIVLLTDGEPDSKRGEDDILLDILRNWKGKQETKSKGNRLIYVMLTNEADGTIGTKIRDIVDDNPDQLSIITPDEDISESVYITLGDKTSLHVRDFFDGTVSRDGRGNVSLAYVSEGPAIPSGYTIHTTTEENDFVEVDAMVMPENGKISIPFRLKKSLQEYLDTLPQDYNLTLVLNFEDNKNFSNVKVIGSSADMEMVLKAEPRVSISWSFE